MFRLGKVAVILVALLSQAAWLSQIREAIGPMTPAFKTAARIVQGVKAHSQGTKRSVAIVELFGDLSSIRWRNKLPHRTKV